MTCRFFAWPLTPAALTLDPLLLRLASCDANLTHCATHVLTLQSVLMQVLREEGPSTYGTQDLEDACDLAGKIVAHYGLTPKGLLLFVPPLAQRARAEAGVRANALGVSALPGADCSCASAVKRLAVRFCGWAPALQPLSALVVSMSPNAQRS